MLKSVVRMVVPPKKDHDQIRGRGRPEERLPSRSRSQILALPLEEVNGCTGERGWLAFPSTKESKVFVPQIETATEIVMGNSTIVDPASTSRFASAPFA